MNRVIRWVLCALLVALAPVLFLHGQANASRPAGPMVMTNGFAVAELARGGLRVRQAADSTTVVVDPRALRLAKRAFAQEPMASNALFVMAVDERARVTGGQGDQALLEAAAAINPRNRYLGVLQMEGFARRGDYDATFAVIDRLSRVHPEVRGEFVVPLVEALRRDDAVDVLAQALARGPSWAREFWSAIPGDPLLVSRMFALRQRVSEGTDASTDARLMAGLISTGRFEDAILFRDSLPGGPPQGTGFVSAGGEPPFGWNLEVSGNRAMTPQGDNAYDLFVQQDTSGVLGQQLLALSPGRYTFSAMITPRSSAGNVSVRFRCATIQGDAGSTKSLEAPATFVVGAGCRAWWLEVMGDAWNVREGLRATISDMRFEAER